MHKIFIFNFVIFSIFTCNKALQCYECGILSLVPGNEESSYKCRSPSEGVDTCSVDLNNNEELPSLFSLSDAWRNKSSNVKEITMSEVCYVLKGKFRNEEILMRGCDVMPLDIKDFKSTQMQITSTEESLSTTTDEDMEKSSSTPKEFSTTSEEIDTEIPPRDLQCLPHFKIWFDTEIGREYIELDSLCVCNTDFCSEPPLQGGVGKLFVNFSYSFFFMGLVLFVNIFLI